MWLSKWYLIWLKYGLCSGGWDWKKPSFHGHMCPAVLLLAHVSVQTVFIWCGLLFCEWEYCVRTFSCFSCSSRLAVYEVWHGPQRKDEIGRKWAWTLCGTCVPGLGSIPGREVFPWMGSVPVGVPGCCAGVHSVLPSTAGPQRKCKHIVLRCSGVAVADGSVRVGHLPWALHQWAGGLGRGFSPRPRSSSSRVSLGSPMGALGGCLVAAAWLWGPSACIRPTAGKEAMMWDVGKQVIWKETFVSLSQSPACFSVKPENNWNQVEFLFRYWNKKLEKNKIKQFLVWDFLCFC